MSEPTVTSDYRPPVGNAGEACEFSLVMPCLDEAETLEICIRKAKGFIERSGISAEVIVADNGSTDGSQEIAVANGARLVEVERKGYGSALMGGIAEARGKYVIMGDSDNSYDWSALEPFVDKLREGYDLVMGNRFKGGIAPRAMPPLHRYFGNPLLTFIGRLFFNSPVGDIQCGLRGFSREAFERLDLQCTGMEFASEMVMKASLLGLNIAEVPTTLSPDGRTRPPHMRSWRDGWRNLRLALIYSPRWLFLYPGLVILGVGLGIMLVEITGPVKIGRATFDTNTMLFGGLFMVLGVIISSFAVLAKVFAVNTGMLPPSRNVDRFLRVFTLERGVLIGLVLTLVGMAGLAYAFFFWESRSFGELVLSEIMRITIPSVTFSIIGIYVIFSSFFIAALQTARKEEAGAQ